MIRHWISWNNFQSRNYYCKLRVITLKSSCFILWQEQIEIESFFMILSVKYMQRDCSRFRVFFLWMSNCKGSVANRRFARVFLRIISLNSDLVLEVVYCSATQSRLCDQYLSFLCKCLVNTKLEFSKSSYCIPFKIRKYIRWQDESLSLELRCA